MSKTAFRFLAVCGAGLLVLVSASVVRAQVERQTFQRGNFLLPAALQGKELGPLEYQNMPWGEIVEDIFRRAKLKIVFDIDKDVAFGRQSEGNLKSERARFTSSLLRVFFSLPNPDLYLDDKGIFHVIPPLKGGGLAERPDLDTKTFTIVETAVPVRALLERFFCEANVPHEIDAAVSGTLSLNFRGSHFRQTLTGLLSNIQGGPELTYLVKDGKFLVYPRELAIFAHPQKCSF